MHCDGKALEFDAVRRLLEKLASTPYGADAARQMAPAPDLIVARSMLAAVTATRAAIDAGEAPLMQNVPDVRAALRQSLSPGAALSGSALRNLRQVIGVVEGLRHAVEARPDIYPGSKVHLNPPPEIAQRLDRTVHASGRVREDASPRLIEIGQQLAKLREEALETLTKRLQRTDCAEFAGVKSIVWQGARVMLTVPADKIERIKGVRRGSSGKEQYFLVEPLEVVATNNRLEALSGRQEGEIQLLLRETTDFLREHLKSLHQMLDALTWIDLAMAGGHLSAHLNAHAPRLVPEPQLMLNRAFHPFLLLQFASGQGPAPVALTLTLDQRQPMLLVTGPNTGGKTVVLKTVGLLVTMAHCGLHIPAEGDCVVGDFSRVIVDIGDPQSLNHHLSTFAGHVETLKRLLSEADERTLVLLDELGTGTDPEEGAALAMAVLDELARRGVHGIVTTHLSPLKAFAEGHKRLTNACMQFDDERLQPTYQLQVGCSGRSLGLVIARKRGLPEELVERARSYLEHLAGNQQ